MLTCENVSYKDRFSDLGFSLIPGALLAIQGRSNTGVILLLNGRLLPTSGIITFEDKPIAHNREYRDLSIYINTETKFWPWERVNRAVKRLAHAGGGAPELAEAALRYWGLNEYRDSPCSTLPVHLQKRVILTQLLTHPRPIWLLDHPEAGLDAEGLNLLDTVIANRCNQDGIVVIATERQGFMNYLPAIDMSDFQPRTLSTIRPTTSA